MSPSCSGMHSTQFLQAAADTFAGASPAALVLCFIAVLVWVPWLINRWRYRHIPGPFAPPVLGNLMGIAALDLHGFLEQCAARHGKLFKIYIGSSMIVCVAEPSDARRLLSKLSTRHIGIPMLAGEDDWDFLQDGLIGQTGKAWHTLRSAWQPAFSAAALQLYVPSMNACLDRMLQHLAPAAASGVVVDLAEELSSMALGMVGEAAYGVDLQSVQPKEPVTPLNASCSSSSEGCLLEAIKAVFAGGGVTNSSSWLVPVLLFPALAPLVQWLAFRWPDAKLQALAKARSVIRQVSMQLVHAWRPGTQQPPAAGAAANGQQPGGDITPAASADLPVQQPDTFPSLMLSARDKETGELLSDELVVAQLNTFLVAAFETTASSIAFAAYLICLHPRVEARLLQELQQHAQGGRRQGSSPAPSAQDLAQLPYVTAVVKETLRLLPPSAIATRTTGKEGYQLTPQVWLPPRVALFACIYCYQRDADCWPDALEFRPERWLPEGADLQPSTPDAYTPFGGGARYCIGKPLANQAVALALVRLLQQYSLELEPGQVPLPLKLTFALVPALGLRVRLRKRGSLA